ncbi:MAG: DUF3048 domain-containing protein [Lachnospiraceae bacterium]|nr:DUF3048 domain-containing protein [Lachnospiraceae bacterium]
MRKKWKLILAGILLGTMLTACSEDPNANVSEEPLLSGEPIVIEEPTLTPPPASEEVQNTQEEENPKATATPKPDLANMYRSELTGEWISKDIENQRPVAIMVDNEILTYPHYGINQADVVYEMMNSTANGRITRFMCLVKDYSQITRFGGVRSIRPTNFLVGFPYEAIFCHDGGPFYINDYTAKKYCYHFSGIFGRFTRTTAERPSWATSYSGRTYASEFTEFATYEDYKNPNTGKTYSGLKSALAKASFSKEYSSSYQGTGFNFLEDEETDLTNEKNVKDATDISLPFSHTSTALKYNKDTKTYDLYEYGNAHTDAEDNDNVTTFKNVLLLNCSFSQLDEHGYMIYNYYNYYGSGSKADGYYLTNGHAIPIKWTKTNKDSEPAHYYNAKTGEELVMNVGKIYISLIPSDSWNKVTIK